MPSRSRSVRHRLAAAALAVSGLAGVTALGAAPAGAVVPAQCVGEAQQFVCGSYESFVDRVPSQGEVDYWAPKMPAKKTLLLTTLGRSIESRQLIIEEYYWDFSDRQVEESEVLYWQDEVLKPNGFRRLEAALYAEFESTPENLVGWAYYGLLGREPSESEVEYWAAQAEATSYSKMTSRLAGTLESRRTRIRYTYLNELDHAPDSAGWAYWAERLRTGTSYLDIRIAIKAAGYPSSSATCSSFTPPVRYECEA